MITDGHCSVQYLDALYDNAKELRDGEGMEKRMVMGIGVGKADFKELEHITGDQKWVKNISDFKQSREVRKVSVGGNIILLSSLLSFVVSSLSLLLLLF